MKKRVFALAFACALLAACHSQGSDGYTFADEEFERTDPAITVVVHPSLADLRAKAPATARQTGGRELMAWSAIRANGCEVHVVDPRKAWFPEWIGHETAHCIWGRWHP